jgi:vacuolar-type H+-ATPase subunit H
MDIQHLVDRLEDLIDEGRHMPFSRFTMIDEERALEIIDQMRISIPEEIEKSNRILGQRDRVLAQANEEAARLLQQARAKGEEMLDQDVGVQAAQNRAANIVEQARQEAEQIRQDADDYARSVLSGLEQTLTRNLSTVRNGINALETDLPPMEEAPIEAQNFPQTTMRDQPKTESQPANISIKRADEVDES